GLADATFESWVTWKGSDGSGTTWQRIFDIGDQSGAGASAVGRTYLFLTASGGQAGGPLRAAYSLSGTTGETVVNSIAGMLPTGAKKQVAVVINDTANTMSLYLDGASVGSVQLVGRLSSINDVNCWLGRSQFAIDPEFNGSLHEFRVYNIALTASQ